MKLQSGYENMSEVPTGFEGAYEEHEGKAVFAGGEFEFRTDAEYSEVHKSKKAFADDYHRVNNELKGFDGINPEEHKSMQDELDELRARSKRGVSNEETIKDIVAAKLKRATEDSTKTISELNNELEELRTYKLNTQKRDVLSDVLGKSVSDDAISDARIIIGQAIERQADGSYMSNGANGFDKGLPLEALVSKAVESRPLWQKQSVPGHGSKGSSGAGGSSTEQQQFQSLLEKDGPLSYAEQQKMTTLAAKIKAERNKGIET